MILSLKPDHVKRYADVVRLLVRYGRAGIGDVTTPGVELEDFDGADDAEQARALARDLEELGPTYVKLGQLLSTRADLFPPVWLEALGRLQEQVEPYPAAAARAIVADDLGIDVDEAFARFDDQPVAAASLAQVHAAELRNGRAVAVKVQRPGIRERIRKDLDALAELATWLEVHTEIGARLGFEGLVESLRRTLLQELDLRHEARNLEQLAAILEPYEWLEVPSPVAELTNSRVLTMDFVRGTKATALTPLGRLDVDGAALAESLFRAYMDQILVHGFLHADPHPGNVFLTEEHRLALLDGGMVGTIPEPHRDALLRLFLALAEGRGSEAAAAGRQLGEELADFDAGRFERDVEALVQRVSGATIDEVDTGRTLLELVQIATACGLRPAPDLSIVAKALLNVDAVARALAPDFEPQRAMREHAQELVRRHSLRALSPSRMVGALLETQELMEQLPSRLNLLLANLAEGGLRFRVDALDEERLMSGFEKIANRIAAGVVIAALLLSAALLMRIDVGPSLLGYPALAVVVFASAALFGFALVASVVVGDWSDRRRSRRGSAGSGAKLR